MKLNLTRRQILTGATLAAATGAAGGFGRNLSALADVTLGPRNGQTGSDTLVVIFQRGGADGLNIVVPHFEDEYYKMRPTLAIARPNDGKADAKSRALDLDGRFGLHPTLAPLQALFHEGKLAAVHAVGSGDQSRSHFEAMATMERGIARNTGAASGWLARHLTATAQPVESPLRAVAFADTTPESLRGAINATALMSLSDFRLIPPKSVLQLPGSGGGPHHETPPSSREQALEATLRTLYGPQGAGQNPADLMQTTGKETLDALDAVKRLDPAHYQPAAGANYPKGDIGEGLRQTACLIKGDVGLEIACLDMGGWDTHVAQARSNGGQPELLMELGQALGAFATDLGSRFTHVTTLVMTEFGRRAYENTSLGTDHGRASCMFLMGGGVAGGKVYTDWPGLEKEKLEEPGDLRVTTDYRDVLAEILARRLKNEHLAEVFPDFTPRFHNILRPA
ncbi:MAG TPA: DUF1501 domain-containing protein [Chthonomonadaceae bacterium]|nr:DUF1501 domain-containing protein [Chthonomonadaceae bacterium]